MQYPWPSWRFTVKKDGGWEPSEKVVSKRKASKTELDEDRKKRQTEKAAHQTHIAQKTRRKRTGFSDILNRAATLFEIAYIEFSRQCAVADFEKSKRPEPPAILSEKYSDEQLLLQGVRIGRFYKDRIHELRSGMT